MNAIMGTWKSGKIVLDSPANWPDGCRVLVEPEVASTIEPSENPETIEKWLAEFDAIPPFEMTPEEEAHWIADRQAIKDYSLEKMKKQTEGDRS